VPGLLKLETITDTLTVPYDNILSISDDLKLIALKYRNKIGIIDNDSVDMLLIEKASPTHRSS
jgi:hypothetical protein